MTPLINLINQRFGKLVVLEVYERKNNKVYWKCQCDCGNITNVIGSSLKNGECKSCGCIGRCKGTSESAANSLFARYKKSAKSRMHDFSLTIEEFLFLTSQNCYYCGIKSKQVSKTSGKTGFYIYNGIDRIDNNLGYTIENCVPCCKQCNIAKMNYSKDEFLAWAKRLSDYQAEH